MADESPKVSVQPPGVPPEAPVCGIDLSGYASISALLATGQAREVVLSNHNITDADWLNVEKTWALRIAAHAQRGNYEVLFRFERAYADALDALTPEEPPRPLPVYAQIMAALESGVPAQVVCVQAGLTLAELGQLQRSWTRRLAKNEELHRQYGTLLKATRTPA